MTFNVGDVVSHTTNPDFQTGIVEEFHPRLNIFLVCWHPTQLKVWQAPNYLKLIKRRATEEQIKSLREDV